METIKRSDFENNKSLYRKAVLLRQFSNGSEVYACRVVCPRCNGEGIVYTHILNGVKMPATPDSGVCYRCCGEKYINGKIRVITDEAYAAKQEKARIKAEKAALEWEQKKLEQIRINTALGYKKVDFKIAGWFYGHSEDVALNHDKFYIIKSETEKAYLIAYMDSLEDTYAASELWLPKKVVIFNANVQKRQRQSKK